MKRKIKIFMHVASWFLLVLAVIMTLAFTYSETARVECKEIEVNFHGDETIQISRQEIIRLVEKADNKLVGKRLRDIHTEIIEQEVSKHNTILKADAYTKVVRDSTKYKGILAVKIRHRTPVMRILSTDANYYMDAKGVRFPTSTRYSANVVIVTGNVNEELARKTLIPFVLYMNAHDFWQAQIKQIHIDRNEELLLTPLVGSQLIEFGTAEDYRQKLRNLMAFYDQVLTSSNWDKYERISLKYKNQIIAKKRD